MKKHKFYYYGRFIRIFQYLILSFLLCAAYLTSGSTRVTLVFFIILTILFIVRIQLSYTALIIDDKKITLYERAIFRVKTVMYPVHKVLNYQVVDKRIILVKNQSPSFNGVGGHQAFISINRFTKNSYKKKALVVKTKKTAHSWGKDISDADVGRLYEVFDRAFKGK